MISAQSRIPPASEAHATPPVIDPPEEPSSALIYVRGRERVLGLPPTPLPRLVLRHLATGHPPRDRLPCGAGSPPGISRWADAPLASLLASPSSRLVPIGADRVFP